MYLNVQNFFLSDMMSLPEISVVSLYYVKTIIVVSFRLSVSKYYGKFALGIKEGKQHEKLS